MKKIKLQEVGAILVIVIVLGIGTYFWLRQKLLRKKFYNMSLNSIVVKRRDWLKSSIDFYLDNGVNLNILVPADDKMKISDSISKPSGTFKYNVYRRNDSMKIFLVGTYDYSLTQ